MNAKNLQESFYQAVRAGRPDIASLLLADGADPNAAGNGGYMPLHWAALEGHDDVVKVLLSHGADIHAKCDLGHSPLYKAAVMGHAGVVDLLLAKGANINTPDDGGLTPLHLAALKTDETVVAMLLAKGADVGIRDSSGRTAAQIASAKGHARVVALLERCESPSQNRDTQLGARARGPNVPEKATLLAKLKVLATMAMADGKIDPQERVQLEAFCARCGLTTEDLDELVSQRMSVDRKELPQSQDEKRDLLIEVLKMAAADGRIEGAERQMAAKIAGVLGLSRDEVKTCVRRAGRPKPVPAGRPESVDDRIDRLWESAKKLGWSDADREKAVSIYSELLTLVEESSKYNACATLRNRAISYRSLKRYDTALDDLTQELQIVQRIGDRVRIIECRKVIEQTREWKRRAEVEAGGGDRAEKFQAAATQAAKLVGTGPQADGVFEDLFAELENGDPDVRAEPSRLLADRTDALVRLISVYQKCTDSDRRRASLAGRVLGRKTAKGSDEMVPAQVTQMLYGVAVAFIPSSCNHCGHLNRGIPAPPKAPMIGYYSRKEDKGAYAVPVLCDKCGREFFVVWDADPR